MTGWINEEKIKKNIKKNSKNKTVKSFLFAVFQFCSFSFLCFAQR